MQPIARNDFRLPLFESVLNVAILCTFLLGAFTTIWLPNHSLPKLIFGASLLALAIHNGKSPRRVQQSTPTARFAWQQMALLTLLACAVMFLICWLTGAFRVKGLDGIWDKSISHWLTVKFPTVLGQQLMLQLLLLPALLRLFHNKWIAIGIGASIFALLHLPNPLLCLFTLIAGAVWMSSYIQRPHLAPIVVSHFLLAIMTAGLCGEYTFGMRVGPACLAMLPNQLMVDDDRKYEFPGCVVGCVERLLQQDQDLIVEGWVADSIHRQRPESMFLMVDGTLEPIQHVEFQVAESSNWENAIQSGYVGKECFSFTAKVDSRRITAGSQVKLFAANANGYLSQLGQMGDIQPVEPIPGNQRIVLFPVEVDGRVNQVIRHPTRMQLKGWAANLQNRSLPDQICLEYGGKLHSIRLNGCRHQRQDIVQSLNDPKFSQSGFDIDLGPVNIYHFEKMRFFVMDQEQQLHPIEMTQQAQLRVAQMVNGNDTNRVWR